MNALDRQVGAIFAEAMGRRYPGTEGQWVITNATGRAAARTVVAAPAGPGRPSTQSESGSRHAA